MDAGSPVGHAGCNNSWECPRVGEIVPSCGECSGGFVTDIKSVIGRERCQGSSRKCIGSVTERHCVRARSRYGLRGVRVGEASNPGPKKRRRRVMSSPDPSDSDLSFLDGFEQDLCSVGWDGGGTQILPTAIQSPGTTVVEESGKPTLFDMTIDDSEEASGGASRVRRRRRLVLVPTQLESTRPTVEDTDCPQTHVDGSDTESWDGNDPQSQDESVVSSRMGSSVAEERGSDQEAEEDDLHTTPSAIFPGRGAITTGFESLDTVDLAEIWKVRAILMKSVPKFLHGVYRFAMRQALDAVKKGHEDRNEMMQIRGWKLFFLVPRLLLFRPRRGGGSVPKKQLEDRVALFQNGEWDVLLEKSLNSSMDGATGRVRRRRNGDSVEKRARRALHMVQLGELSAGRQALEGASLAPGDKKTLEALKDPDRRPALPRNSVPDDISQFAPAEEFSLAQDLFLANVRSARRGAALGPSGMTADHVRPLLEAHGDAAALSHAASLLARNEMPEEVMVAIRCGRITALQKPDGGVRGIVVGGHFQEIRCSNHCPAVQSQG